MSDVDGESNTFDVDSIINEIASGMSDIESDNAIVKNNDYSTFAPIDQSENEIEQITNKTRNSKLNRKKLKLKRLARREKRNNTFNMSINMNNIDDDDDACNVKTTAKPAAKRKSSTLDTILKVVQYPINMYTAYMLINQFGFGGVLMRSLLDNVLQSTTDPLGTETINDQPSF